LAGRADVMFEAMPTLVGYIKSGKLRALAVGTKTRSPVFPEIPTVAEFLPGYEATVWFGIGAPGKTPEEIVERLNKEINAGLNDPTCARESASLAASGSPAAAPISESSSSTTHRNGPRSCARPISSRSDL
jgi:tripartite-type tricarboxylate transporter receptor subunit TctC